MSKPAARVRDVRKGSGYADAWFTTVVGFEDDQGQFHGVVSIRDCELRTSQQNERYIKFPSKPRIRKVDESTAAYQKGDDGKTIYDQVADSAMEQVNEKWTPTKAARKFKDLITAQVVTASATIGSETAGRGTGAAARPAAAKSRTGVAATTGTKEAGSPLAESDDLPF